MVKNLEKVCAVICAYNEERTIEDVVKNTYMISDINDVVVVDDGSTDKTAKLAKKAGAIILLHKRNFGKGAALRTGFDYFLSNNYDAIVTLDADGQHLPEEIPLLINKLNEGYDAVIGKRNFRVKNTPFSRRTGNMVFSYLLSKINKADIPDAESGFRIFRRNPILSFYNEIKNDGFPFEAELVVKLVKYNFKVGWVDVSTIYYHGRKSKIKSFKHSYESLKLCFKCFFNNI
jgi:glycosyltransferase involved in cell wall biosynthesis